MGCFEHVLLFYSCSFVLRLFFSFKVIAVTGGVASGKTTFCQFLQKRLKRKVSTVCLDKITRSLQTPDSAIFSKIVKLFAAYKNEFLETSSDGVLFINRKKFREFLMHTDQRLKDLSKLILPHIYARALAQIICAFFTVRRPVVIEVPLLFEQGLQNFFSETVLVYSSQKNQISRASENRNLTVKETVQILDKQISNDVKRKFAGIIIENDGSLRDLHTLTVFYAHRLRRKEKGSALFQPTLLSLLGGFFVYVLLLLTN